MKSTSNLLGKLKSGQILIPFALVCIAPWILLAPVFLTGKVLFWGTPFLQFVPWREWAWRMLFAGKLPLWNPYVGMGAPLIANYQSALFYPPNLLLGLLQLVAGVGGQAWGQAILVAAHLSWAGTGMILLARRLEIRPLGQAIAGLAFSLSSYLVARSGFLSINATVAWMPWVVWGTDRIIECGVFNRPLVSLSTVKMLVPFILCLGFQLLAGHAQSAWYTILFSLAWLVFWAIQKNGLRKLGYALLLFGAGAIFAACLAGIQLLPTGEYLLQSQRSGAVAYDYAVNYSFWPWRLLSLLAPDLFGNPAHGDYWFPVYFWEDAVYVGLLPILLAISAIFSAGLKRRSMVLITYPRYQNRAFIWLLVLITGLAFLLALGAYTPVYPFFYRYVPTFAMFQAPTRFSLLAVFSLCLLSAVGSQFWRRPTRRGLYWSRLGTAGAFAITLGAGLGWFFMRGVRPTFIRALALAGFWALGAGILNLTAPEDRDESKSPAWSYGVIFWIALDLLVAGWGLNPGSPPDLYTRPAQTAQTALEAAGDGRIFLPADVEYDLKFNRFLKIRTFEIGEDITRLRQVFLPNANMLDRLPSANNFDPLVPARYARWMDHLQTRSSNEIPWWLAWMNVNAVERQEPTSASGIQFLSQPGTKRFRWFPCAIQAKNGEDAWDKVNFQQNKPLLVSGMSVPLVIETGTENLSAQDCNAGQEVEMALTGDEPNRVALTVRSSRAGWLFQADTWYPGWQAYVDHQPATLLRAEYLFRAVAVPAGKHLVEFVYRPVSFTLGVILTFLTVLGLGSILLKQRWQGRAE
ncbi:MAG TPA: YfhO family protein [Anaerolineaceae bacterium]|nr:YfhO family protein [Anaerolineaceae bacterium]